TLPYLLPLPTLGERGHGSVACRFVAVRRRAILVVPEGHRPQPRRSGLRDPADDNAIGKHVVIVGAPLAGRAGSRCALQDQLIRPTGGHLLRWGFSSPSLSVWGHFRKIGTLPPLAACPLRSKSGQANACLDLSALCHVWTAPSWQDFSSRLQAGSVQPCVRPVSAAHKAAGHNAFRGSGPSQKPAFEMHWHKWVVLIAGSTGSALRAVGPPNLHITPDVGAIG